MSDKLKHKMQVWEVSPPVEAWQTIASRLQDDVQHAGLMQRFEKLEIVPPASLFNTIAERLAADAQYQPISDKMHTAAITPPANNWQAIAERLQIPAEHTHLADKLYPLQVTPPVNSWNQIAAALENKTTETPVVKLKPNWYKYAAAAVIIGIIATAVYLVSNNATTPFKNEITVNKKPGATNAAATVGSNNNNIGNLKTEKIAPTGVYIYNKQGNEVEDISYASVAAVHSIAETPIIINSPLIRDETGAVIRDIEQITMNGNYLMVTGPNGQPTRISAKFSNILGYLTGGGNEDTEEGIDRIMKESSLWKKRFQEWRKKISQSQFSPAGGNFLDIEAFKELIKEEQ